MEHHLILVIVLVLTLGLLAQWLAWRLQLPAIVLLALTGLIAGPGLGIIQPSADLGELLSPLIKLGVAVILFEGGMNLDRKRILRESDPIRRLVTLGAVITLVLDDGVVLFHGPAETLGLLRQLLDQVRHAGRG